MSANPPGFIPVMPELAQSVLETYDEGDPRFCGYRWWMCLIHRDGWMWALVAGTVPGREDYWEDYSAAAAYLDGWSLASGVIETERDDVRRMRLVRLPAEYGQSADAVYVETGGDAEGRHLNLVRCSDGTWRAWSLGPLDLTEIPERL